jgi:hypothetical protein
MTPLSNDTLKANRLARALRGQNSPTTGEQAFRFWELCTNYHNDVPVRIAKRLFLKAGYQPFNGYPLQHKESKT